jgi:AraC family transcriptional regulator of adaptative response/methylated-DNA-[protein]-cysteine methyltransferase
VKSQVREWLASGDFRKIVYVALKHDRTLSILIALTYDADPLVCWRAIDGIGRCAACMSANKCGLMKEHLRRLFWKMSDESGSIAWHAPEAIGEIIRSEPDTFADFIPLTESLLDMEPEDKPPFMPGILYAQGRIGEVVPDSLLESLPRIFEALNEKNPQARAMAVWCLGRLRAAGLLTQRPDLGHDRARALVYRNERLVETTIERLFVEACDAASRTQTQQYRDS